MKLANLTAKVQGMKFNVVKVLAAATLAGGLLVAATPAAQAQQFGVAVGFGGPRYYAPAPPVAVYGGYGYNAPVVYGNGYGYGDGDGDGWRNRVGYYGYGYGYGDDRRGWGGDDRRGWGGDDHRGWGGDDHREGGWGRR